MWPDSSHHCWKDLITKLTPAKVESRDAVVPKEWSEWTADNTVTKTERRNPSSNAIILA